MRDVVTYNMFAIVTYNFGGFILAGCMLFVAYFIENMQTRDRFILASAIPSSLQVLISVYHGGGTAAILMTVLVLTHFALAKWVHEHAATSSNVEG